MRLLYASDFPLRKGRWASSPVESVSWTITPVQLILRVSSAPRSVDNACPFYPVHRPSPPPRARKRGQVTFSIEVFFIFFGLPCRRKADSRPNAAAVCACQGSSPKGAPRTTDRRRAASSPSVSAPLTYSVQ